MFARFDLELTEPDKTVLRGYKTIGEEIYSSQAERLDSSLDKYITNDQLDAEMITNDWFPMVNADVFLSHAHADSELVKCFAGYLKKRFNISSFIDSCVWGYADELLRKLDNDYCSFTDKYGQRFYDYNKRNQSSAHVHLMLMGALMKMINRTECLIFINTPASISAKDIGNGARTASPWIYSELLCATEFPHSPLARRTDSSAFREKTLFSSMSYKVDADSLTQLSFGDFRELEKLRSEKASDYLDFLYKNKRID